MMVLPTSMLLIIKTDSNGVLTHNSVDFCKAYQALLANRQTMAAASRLSCLHLLAFRSARRFWRIDVMYHLTDLSDPWVPRRKVPKR